LKILTIDYNDYNFSRNFVKSLHDSGFAIIKNHSVSQTLIKQCYDDWEFFFKSEKKNDYLFDYEKQDGYFPFKSENAKDYRAKDLKEFYHIYPNWGRYPDFINDNALILFNTLINLGKNLLEHIHNYSPPEIVGNFSIPLYEMIDNSNQNLLRIIHYPPINEEDRENALRAAPHADINLITLLLAGSSRGLQVKTKDGNWLDVDFKENELVVNIGDMLQLCSNNYYPSTLHRVINPIESKNIPRYSMPFFIHPRKDIQLSKELTANQYLNQRLRDLGLK